MLWTADELSRIGNTAELQLASCRPDGTVGPFTTMWVVQSGNDLYVRSAGGPDRPWYRQARASGLGRIRAGGVERAVIFGYALSEATNEIDAAYHAKYDRYGPGPVSHVTGSESHPVTIRLIRSEA